MKRARKILEDAKVWLRTAVPYQGGGTSNTHPLYVLATEIINEIAKLKEIIAPTLSEITINGKSYTIYEKDRELFEELVNLSSLKDMLDAQEQLIAKIQESCKALQAKLRSNEEETNQALKELLDLVSSTGAKNE